MPATLVQALYKMMMTGIAPDEIIQMITPKLQLPDELIANIESYNTTCDINTGYLLSIVSGGSEAFKRLSEQDVLSNHPTSIEIGNLLLIHDLNLDTWCMTNTLDNLIINNEFSMATKLVEKYGKSRFLRSESLITESLRYITQFSIEHEKFLDSLLSV